MEGNAIETGAIRAASEQSDAENTEQPVYAVNRERADRIVNFQRVLDEADSDDHQYASDQTNKTDA